jgi:branched-chain amino acid transport system substrate-binding protein
MTGMDRRNFVKATGAGAAGAGLTGCLGGGSDGGGGGDGPTVGILEDRSGNFALVGTPKWQATRLAVEEINEQGGVLGEEVSIFDPDPQSDNTRYQQLTEQAIQQRDVDALWAGYSSATREAIRPIIDREDQLYFYTTQYEGGVCDHNIFPVGATARQQLGIVIPYMIEEFGPEAYTIAADYNFGQLSADWTRIILDENDGELVGEEFIPLSSSSFGSTINRIQEADPDFIVSMLVGSNHQAFYDQRAAAGIDGIPIATSTELAQGYEHLRLDPPAMDGVYAGVNYVQEIDTSANEDFVSAMEERWGDDLEYVNQECENNYFSVYMWRDAVEEAGTFDQEEVKSVLEEGMDVSAPEGDVSLDGATHHMTHNMRIMRCDDGHSISFVGEEELIEPTFLREDVGCNLPEEDEETQYFPSDFYDLPFQDV